MFSKFAFPIFAALLLNSTPLVFAGDGPTADEVVTRLIEGNKRFVAGTSTHPHQAIAYRASLAAGQKPFVTILTCSDSRVSPELVFDLGLGDVFVDRVAGNIVDDAGLGSIEYAVEHLHTPLLVVLGHEKCGAVKAAVDGGSPAGHIGVLVEKIAPAVVEARALPGDLVSNAVRANVQKVVKLLTVCEPVLSEHVHNGTLKVVGARYNVATGEVEFFPSPFPTPSAAAATEEPKEPASTAEAK